MFSKALSALVLALFASCATTAKQEPQRTPQRVENKARAYFIGVAGHDAQAVFANEVELAHQLLDRSFCFEKEWRLENKKGAKQKATLEGLEAAIAAYESEAKENDVLVLYIASHGTRKGIALRDKETKLNETLTPSQLSAWLGKTKRERLVFVSACYAGVFVEALSDSKSAVATAADQKSPSFGCQASRDLTYFGEFFWSEPRASASLNRRYVDARKGIRQLENKKRLPSSNPLLSVGEEVRHWNAPLCAKPNP